MMVQRLVVVLLVLMVVFVGCGEDEPEKVKPKENEGPVKEITWEKDGSKMALIPAGSFEMGDSKNDPENYMKRSRPVHTVELDGFYMDIHEVTVGQFKQFVNQSGYAYGGNWKEVGKYSVGDDYPMVWVSWNDAVAYCEWAGKRLPTEAEWEYAARGGLAGKRYLWGEEMAHDGSDEREYTNFFGTGGKDKWDEQTAPVGSFDANGYGLHDMAGNVLEWCSDWHGSDYYSKSHLRNPKGPSSGSYRVLRGGSWNSSTHVLRVAYRNIFNPTPFNLNFGFRCVADVEE